MANDTLRFTVTLRDQISGALDKVNKSLDGTAASADKVAKASDSKKFGFGQSAKDAGVLGKALESTKRVTSGFVSKVSGAARSIAGVGDQVRQFNDESKLNQRLAEMSGQKLTKLGAAAYTAETKYGKLGQATSKFYDRFKPQIEKVAPIAKRAFDGMASAVKAGVDKTKSFIGSLPEKAKNAAAKAGGALKSLGKTALGVASTIVAAGLGVALTKGFSRLQNIEQAEAKLRGLGHSAKSVSKLMENANAAVTGTAFGLDEAAGVAATMAAAGVKAGSEMTNTLTLVGDAATIGGSTMSEMGSIFGKVAAKGKLDGEVMAQLLDRQIGLLPALAKHYNVSAEEASKMVSAGKVDFKTFASVMEEMLGGAAQKSGETFVGAFANMKAALGRIGATLLEPFFSSAPTMLVGLTGLLDKINEALKPIMESVGEKLAPVFEKISDAMAAFAEGGMSGLLSKFSDFAPILAPVIGALAAVAGGMAKNLPFIGRLLSAVNPLLGAFIGLAIASPELRDGIMQVVSSLGGSLMGILDSLAPSFDMLMGVITTLLNDVLAMLIPVIVDLADVLGPVLGSVIEGILPLFGVLVGVGVSLIRSLLPVFGIILEAVMPLVSAVGGLIQALMPIVSLLAPLVAFLAAILIPVIQVLATVVAVVFKGIAWVITGVVNIISGVLNGLVSFFTDILPGAITWFQESVLPIFAAIGTGIVTAFGAVVDWFQNTALPVISAVWDGIAAGATWLWENVLSPIWTVMQFAFLAVMTAMMLAWELVLKPAWNAISAAATWLWENALKPVFGFIQDGWNLLLNGIKLYWEMVLKPVWNAVSAAATWLWENGVKPAFNGFKLGWNLLVAGVKLLWESVLKPAWNAVAAGAKWLWENGVRPVFNSFKAGWKVLGDAIKWVKDNVISPVFRAVKSAGDTMWSGLKTIFDSVKSGIKGVGDGFKLAKDVIKSAWDGIKSAAKKPAEFVVNTVYSKIRSIWNKAAGVFGMDDKKLPEIKMATGGHAHGRVLGAGTGTSDSINAKLSNGEFVVNANATRQHLPLLHAINGPGGVGAKEFASKRGAGAPVMSGGRAAFASGGTLMDATDWWMGKGVRGSEHPRFGRVGTHSRNSLHYSGNAVDLNYGPGGQNATEQRFFDNNVGAFKKAFPGIRVIWRAPGHFNHMHIDTGKGADIGNFSGAGAGGSGGGSIFDISPITSLMKKVKGFANTSGLFGKGVVNSGKNIVQGALDKINPLNAMDKFGQGVKDVVTSGKGKARGALWAAAQGWPPFGKRWNALDYIVSRESGWRPDAKNPSSTASGLGQMINSTAQQFLGGSPMSRFPFDQQLKAIVNYTQDRYGGLVKAKKFWQSHHYYNDGGQVGGDPTGGAGSVGVFDNGGPWAPGTVGMNSSGRTEMVLTADQADIVTSGLRAMVGASTGGGGGLTVGNIEINVNGDVNGVDDLDDYLREAVEKLMIEIEREWEERR